ncbi:MAG: DNA polymerase domain-containing protein [Nitrospinota bacterium]
METVEGTLFDVYIVGAEARLWVLTREGPRLLRHAYRPRVYLEGKEAPLNRLVGLLQGRRLINGARWTEKAEFWSGEHVRVLELEVTGAAHYEKLSQVLPDHEGPLRIYNADLPLPQAYLYETGLFPCGKLRAELRGDEAHTIEATESPWEDFRLPDLKVLELEPLGESPGQLPGIRVTWEGRDYEIQPEGPDELVSELNSLLDSADPDLILTTQGDPFLFPWLLRAEALAKTGLHLDRDPGAPRRPLRSEGRSYFTYGRILYSPPRYPLYGRWHIDRDTSFMYAEGGLEGIVELSRLSKIPVQASARSSPGTAISSMQLDEAFRQDIPIPWRKGEPEAFKTPWTLFIADKGGLTYAPQVGAFENVAEIDFASMYPAIMVAHNVSPETVLCPCCEADGARVPESGYHLCRRREGLVPRVLAPILRRREEYKRLKREAKTEEDRTRFDRRQRALKWVLVTCFGYLGYRNARFGRIEAHEAVTAFGRETLLQAKEVAEGKGYRMLHALTDSLWIQGEDVSEAALEALVGEVRKRTHIPMALEGVYRWVHFLPSKQRPKVGVPSRFFGIFCGGGMKARGIAYRRRDTPRFIREAQLSALKVLSAARDLSEYQDLIPKAAEELEWRREALRAGNVFSHHLLLSRRMSRDASSYKVDNWTALAAKQYERAGIRLHPGETVSFLLKNVKDPVKEERVRAAPFIRPEDGYDVEKYEGLLDRAAEELWIALRTNHLSRER